MNPLPGLQRFALRLLRPRMDVPLLLAILLVIMVGLLTLASASGGNERLVVSQALRMGMGLAAMLVLSRIPPGQLRLWTPWLFVASLVVLMLVPVIGTGRSARSWLNLGFFYLQPGELLKLTLPMMVAWVLHRELLPPRWRTLFLAGTVIAVPTGLIAIQPDLGTAMLVAASGAFVVFLGGIGWWRIVAILGMAAAVAPIGWQFLREYHRDRLRMFLNPEADPLGAGWNIIQSKIAVGSGGLFGKGWGQGSQSRLEFLPEHTTDFVFAVFSEEFGLLGVLLMLSLYLFIVGRSLWIAANARDTWARLLGGALALTFLVYVVVNGGMICGLLPVIGVPMPLMSYGGTSAVTLLAGFGIVMSLHAHRKMMGS